MTSPASNLNIGPGAGQNHFSAQLARTGDADILVKTQADIAAGYDEAPYFTAVGSAVQFNARADAPKTSTDATGARAELREAGEDGLDYAFYPFDGGTHYIKGTVTITHHPTSGPSIANIGLTLAQLQNGSRDRLTFRTQFVGSPATLRLRYRENGVSVWQGTDTTSGNLEIGPGPRDAAGSDIWNASGTISWDYMLKLYGGNGLSGTSGSCTAELWINGVLWRKNTAFTNVDGVGSTWYFKTPEYNQFDTTNVASTEFGQVQLSNLEHWHTGWATPSTGGGGGGGTGPVQFRSASSANQSSGTSMTVPKPAGVVSGDLLVAIQAQDADGTSVNDLTASGWTQLGAQAGGTSGSRSPWAKAWRKIAGASEPSSYTFGDSDNSNHAVVITSFVAGTFDPDNPIAAGPTFQTSQGQTNSTSHVAPSVAGVAGGMLVTGHCADTGGTAGSYTPPPGMTEQQDTAASFVGIEANTELLNATGATNTRTAINTRSSGRNCVSLVVAPPPATAAPGNWLAFFSQ